MKRFWAMLLVLWPFSKDRAKLRAAYREEGKERYNLLSPDTDWASVKELIVHYNSMGWPNGAKQIYGLAHKEAVEEIMDAFIRVRQEISPEIYDQSVFEDAMKYKKFLGDWKEATSFEDFLKQTPEENFF